MKAWPRDPQDVETTIVAFHVHALFDRNARGDEFDLVGWQVECVACGWRQTVPAARADWHLRHHLTQCLHGPGAS